MEFTDYIENVGKAIDAVGVAAIVIGALIATYFFARRAYSRMEAEANYRMYRRALGRSILLGLELLVAADIVRTVAASPTFRSVGVLAVIVLIRTFLSFSLELELTHRFPWQEEPNEATGSRQPSS